MTSAEPVLLTVAEVAALLRTTSKAVDAMASRGQLPGVREFGPTEVILTARNSGLGSPQPAGRR